MSGDKVRAAKAKLHALPEGAKGDGRIHVHVYDVFNDGFQTGKAFDNVERAVQFQRQEQERIYIEQEAEPELFDLPFLSHDPDLIARVARDPEYRKRLVRELKSDARGRSRRH